MTQPDEELLTLQDLEASPEDAAEQALPADPNDRVPVTVRARPWDANEYDAIEQDREVQLDDDYR